MAEGVERPRRLRSRHEMPVVPSLRIKLVDEVQSGRGSDEGLLEALNGGNDGAIVVEGKASVEDLVGGFGEAGGQGEVVGADGFDEDFPNFLQAVERKG